MGMLANRVRKNYAHLRRWAERENYQSFRVYQSDIPEYPVTVDLYGDYIVAWADYRKRDQDFTARQEFLAEVTSEICQAFEKPAASIFLKERRPGGQYQKQDGRTCQEVIREGQLKFWVNLSDYHDTGLFLDHRLTRAMVAQLCHGKSMLNLFCYTGSFTVYAAAAQARETVSVDLSGRYLDWLERNLELNDQAYARHLLVNADVLEWLSEATAKHKLYDIIVCDPPTFSNAKRTGTVLDITRDYIKLIQQCLHILAPGGQLFFSTNKKGFKLDQDLFPGIQVNDITKATIPADFANRQPHRAWTFSRKRLVISTKTAK